MNDAAKVGKHQCYHILTTYTYRLIGRIFDVTEYLDFNLDAHEENDEEPPYIANE